DLAGYRHATGNELRRARRALDDVALEVIERRGVRHAILVTGHQQPRRSKHIQLLRPELVHDGLTEPPLGPRVSLRLEPVGNEMVGRIVDAFTVLAGGDTEAVRRAHTRDESAELILKGDVHRGELARLERVALKVVERRRGLRALTVGVARKHRSP